MKTYLPMLIRAGRFPGLVFFTHCLLSLGFDAYERLPWLDVPMHLAGGAAIARFFDLVIADLDRRDVLRVGGRPAALVMVFGLVAASTVVWEFAEFLADVFFDAGAQPGLANTMKDQLMGLVGGIFYIGVLNKMPAEAGAAGRLPDQAA